VVRSFCFGLISAPHQLKDRTTTNFKKDRTPSGINR
jgi:hypothetical protein